MLQPVLIGIAIFAATVLIQVSAIFVLIKIHANFLRKSSDEFLIRQELTHLVWTIIVVVCGHVLQIGLWALVFMLYGEFESFDVAFYHSAVNFTSLGYGDIVMSEEWRTLGPLEAANGVMMFGLSTALYFAVLNRMFQRLLATQK